MALDPTGLVQWAVRDTLDRVIKYVGEANKYWDHCQELEKYLDKIGPMVREAIQNLDQNSQVASSSTRSGASAETAADKWLRDLEPLLREAESVLKGALDWVGQCNSVHRTLAISTKKKWADKIRAVTQDLQKVGQYEIPFATHAKLLDMEKTITLGFSMILSRGFPNRALAVMMSQEESKMLQEVGEAFIKLVGEADSEMQKVAEASIKKHMKKIKKAILMEEQTKQEKAQLEAALKRLERIDSHGEAEQFRVEETTSTLPGVQQGDHLQPQGDARSTRAAGLVAYSRREIQAATNDFRSEIGRGGFGAVYFGILPGGLSIAVKVATGASPGSRLVFVRELEVMSKCRHQNILMLYGYCISNSERRQKGWWKNVVRKVQQKPFSTIRAGVTSADELMIVTEFAENGSVDDYLGEDAANSLNWEDRFRIIVGAATGLVYLHHASGLHIVHRDIKPANIFLDEHMCPKIGDFGSCLDQKDDATEVTAIEGTLGFLDPAYFGRFEGLKMVSVDVYSFGITILCIVSGRRALYLSQRNPVHLLKWVVQKMEQGDVIVDSRITCEPYPEAEVSRVVHVALLCAQIEHQLRPTMTQVLSMLVGETEPKPSVSELLVNHRSDD